METSVISYQTGSSVEPIEPVEPYDFDREIENRIKRVTIQEEKEESYQNNSNSHSNSNRSRNSHRLLLQNNQTAPPVPHPFQRQQSKDAEFYDNNNTKTRDTSIHSLGVSFASDSGFLSDHTGYTGRRFPSSFVDSDIETGSSSLGSESEFSLRDGRTEFVEDISAGDQDYLPESEEYSNDLAESESDQDIDKIVYLVNYLASESKKQISNNDNDQDNDSDKNNNQEQTQEQKQEQPQQQQQHLRPPQAQRQSLLQAPNSNFLQRRTSLSESITKSPKYPTLEFHLFGELIPELQGGNRRQNQQNQQNQNRNQQRKPQQQHTDKSTHRDTESKRDQENKKEEKEEEYPEQVEGNNNNNTNTNSIQINMALSPDDAKDASGVFEKNLGLIIKVD